MVDFKELINSIRKENITLFIGSGFSLKAGAPSAYSLVNAINNTLPEDEKIDGNDLDKVSEEYEQMHNRESLMKIIRDKMSFIPTDTSDHQKLTRIPHIHTIITTNYDTLLEDIYGQEKCYVVRNTQDLTNLSKDKVNIIKIHGDFQSEESILLTKQDYTNYFVKTKDSLLWKFVQAEILTKDILFIGYSLEDSNVLEIIKQVKKETNGQPRKFFLIAPGLKSYKVNRLAETKVKYYDAKAEDLFSPLFESLDKHIKQDYNKNKISFKTLSQYSRQHNLEAIGVEGEKKNSVSFNTIGQAEVNINLRIEKILAQKLMNNDPSIYKDTFHGSLVPGLKLPTKSLNNIEVLINGMTIGTNEDLSYLIISPTSETVSCSLKIKDTGFNEKIKFVRFNLGNQIVFKSKVQPFTIQFIFTIDYINKSISCTCNITLNETYQDNSDALKWIELPIALWGNKELIISLLPTMPLKFPNKIQYANNFNQVRRYYQNIRNIELWYDIEFDSYINFSPEHFELSELLVNAYKEKFFSIPNDDEEHTFEVEGDADKLRSNIELQDETCSLSMSYMQEEPKEFNGHLFTFKPKYIFASNCKILSVTQLSNNKIKVSVKLKKNCLYQIYTDNGISDISEMWNVALQSKTKI